ncbi:hypothetical protein [Sorangium cellulosum]|uniref:hypothetical protein n=1 Tax=Sorangium cellulosum TaxID=56 RepID=UPI0002DB42E9|nr:hypothetical protein [Sorangium cellulosum]
MAARHHCVRDAQGKVSFSRPGSERQRVNRNDGREALFPYGFALITADQDTIGELSEASIGADCN